MSYLGLMSIVRPKSRADRLDLLTRVLADRPGTTARELAREFGQSVRTVFRDLDALRDRGYPIDSARGRGGGLRLHSSWGLGRVLLSRDEALGTLLGLAIAEKLGSPMFTPETARARRKIADAFPASERRRIAPLRERVFIGEPASAQIRRSYGAPAAAPMRRLQAAFVDESVVQTEYVKEGGAHSHRLIEPHALIINWPAWYVVGYDRLREAARTFRLDRFVSVEITPERFRSRAQQLVDDLLEQGVRLERI